MEDRPFISCFRSVRAGNIFKQARKRVVLLCAFTYRMRQDKGTNEKRRIVNAQIDHDQYSAGIIDLKIALEYGLHKLH